MLDILLEEVSPRQLDRLLKIYKQAPQYCLNVEGRLPDRVMMEKEFQDGGPKKKSDKYQRKVYIFIIDNRDVGLTDLHLNHPQDGVAYIGLLLLTERLHGKGVGHQAYQLIEKDLKYKHDIQKIKLGVSENNNVEPFWEKMGFERNGHTYQWGHEKMSEVFEMEKVI